MKRILITGAIGNIGGEIISQLPVTVLQVRAPVRNPDTSTVAELTASPARTFREWATDYASQFRV